jgi:hypothetical protein
LLQISQLAKPITASIISTTAPITDTDTDTEEAADAKLLAGGRMVVGALATVAGGHNSLLAQSRARSSPDLEQRIAGIIAAYDAQGNHRTATAVDEMSAEWLASEVQEIGIKAEFEPFAVTRIDPVACYLRINDRRIGGLPLFDAGFTGPEGVRGKLGPLGSDAEIGLVETGPAGRRPDRSKKRGVAATRQWCY